MADNAARGMIPIDLDKPRILWYNFTAMKELKEKHNIRIGNLDKMLSDSEQDLDYDNLSILLAYGLRHEDKSITPEWVVDHVGIVDLVRYMNAIKRAFVGQLDEPDVSAAPPKAVKGK